MLPPQSGNGKPPPTPQDPKAPRLDLLSRLQQMVELDPRTRINLQEALIQFIRTEKKWTLLPLPEQTRLLQRVTTRNNSHNPFSELITIQSQDEKGNVITRQAYLLLDASRNKFLSDLFDQVVNHQIAVVFYEEIGYGILEHLDRLIALELRLMTLDNVEQGQMLPVSYGDLENSFLPLSPRDLEVIRDGGFGIMIQLVPKFLRLPLNNLYAAVKSRTGEFPSLALQFYLDMYFARWGQMDEFALDRQNLLRTFFTKAFYAIIRLGGLDREHLNLPEANRSDRFDFITLDDEDPMQVLKADPTRTLSHNYDRLRAELERLREQERQLRQKREVKGPAMKVELTLDKVLEDIFHIYRDQDGAGSVDEAAYLKQTIWLPRRLEVLSEWDQQTIQQHVTTIDSEEHLAHISQSERNLFQRWANLIELEGSDEQIQSQLQAIEGMTTDIFHQELKLRLAEIHRQIAFQDKDLIIERAAQQVTRLLKTGTVQANMVVRERYDSFNQHVLPHIYFYRTQDAAGEEIWVDSPYPLSKLFCVIQSMDLSGGSDQIDGVTLALARELLIELLLIERGRLDGG